MNGAAARTRIPREALLALIAVTVAGAALRFATLGTQSYWFDEAFTVVQLRWPVHDMLAGLDTYQATPPLFYLVASVWTSVFGDGEVGFRALSALCGTAAIPLTYAAGARLASVRAGLIAAALVAASPALVWYSQEARPYALLTLLAAASMYFFARALDSQGRADLAGWAVTAALAETTHYFAAFLVLPAGAWLILHTTRARRWAIAATAAVAATGLALLPLALAQRSDGRGSYIDDEPVLDRLRDVVKQGVAGPTLAPGRFLGVCTLVLLVAGLVLVSRSRGRERAGGLLALGLTAAALGIPVLMGVAGYDYLLVRNVLAAWIPLAIAAGVGLAGVRATQAGAALLVAAMAAIVIAVAAKPAYQRDDWRGAARTVDRSPRARAVVASPGYASNVAGLYLHGARRTPPALRRPIRELVFIGTAPPPRFDPRRAGLGPVRVAAISRPQKVGVVVLALRCTRRVSAADLVRRGVADGAGSVLFQPGSR